VKSVVDKLTIHNEVIVVKAPDSNNDFSHRMIKNFSRVFGFLKMWLYPLESIKYKSKPALAVGCLSFKNLQNASLINDKMYCHIINK
jgi:patatin-like phospholipase/acyl hydrolase